MIKSYCVRLFFLTLWNNSFCCLCIMEPGSVIEQALDKTSPIRSLIVLLEEQIHSVRQGGVSYEDRPIIGDDGSAA